jgi:hypothetical protein
MTEITAVAKQSGMNVNGARDCSGTITCIPSASCNNSTRLLKIIRAELHQQGTLVNGVEAFKIFFFAAEQVVVNRFHLRRGMGY